MGLSFSSFWSVWSILVSPSKFVASSPTAEYFNIITSNPSFNLVQPSPKLIILDLNGTLVFRRKTRKVTKRPFLDEFINYLFNDDNFFVMIWTTARPENTEIMVDLIFGDQKEKLIAIWNRKKFDLTNREYERNTKPIKNLDMIWNDLNSQIASGKLFKNNLKISFDLVFDLKNTILIDDSKYKTKLQPFNAIHPCEFNRERVRNGEDSELKRIIEYLEVVKYQSNVAAYMKDNPFS
ncbi:HAD-like domain-containing protein [Glomus cerebriforme]|uniref:Mitochondrial import inner membrane translocase subunit TIM50 n=1 Tax=Glomus cerebriforme TaxID=658196 RepID=A0A397TQL5_9GLOM|nr:HAD-like domain-containing protein [Glomus cerebriforme]